MIRIVNLKNYKPLPNEILIKVDRSSPVGNPFYMKDESMRDEVCNKYDIYYNKQIGKNTTFTSYIETIFTNYLNSDIALGCWCYPKRCHAETIKRFVEDALYK